MNYGFLLAERPGGSSTEEIGRGIDHIRSSLEERSPEVNVIDWAYSLLNLGLLHQRRGDPEDDVIAAECYAQALARLRPDDDLQLWTTLQHNRADMLIVAEIPNLDDAESAVRSALAQIDISVDPLLAGRLIWQLARIVDRRAGAVSPESIRLRREALDLLDPQLAPTLHLRIGAELADSYTEMKDWSRAATVYSSMLEAFDYLYDVQTSPDGRRAALAEHPRLARWAAYVFARVGRLEEAVEVIEHGRARQLSVAVSRDTADLARLAHLDHQLADQYRAALSSYRRVLNEAAALVPGIGVGTRISVAEQEVRRIVQQIRDVPGFERFLLRMAVADISGGVGEHPVIYLINAPWGSFALVVQPDSRGDVTVTGISIPEVTSRDVAQVVLVGANGEAGLISAQSAAPFVSRLLPAALKRLGELEPLLRPIAEVLSHAPRHMAVVIPTGLLGLIPLPAAIVEGEILDDVGEIHLAPSAAVYIACRIRARQGRSKYLVGIADPDGTLPGSRAELATINDLFEPDSRTDCAVGEEATRAWVLEHAPVASHLHLACHGASTLSSAVGGTLRLAGDDVLTIDDLLDGRLADCRLAVASACQSGHYATTDAPDEFTGLPAGFLQAGAACAVVSLWQVRDDITSLFMARFYELMQQVGSDSEESPVANLREARKWIRGLSSDQAEAFKATHPRLSRSSSSIGVDDYGAPDRGTNPYSSPECWAAFVAWGR